VSSIPYAIMPRLRVERKAGLPPSRASRPLQVEYAVGDVDATCAADAKAD
jgi:hypothetical protein